MLPERAIGAPSIDAVESTRNWVSPVMSRTPRMFPMMGVAAVYHTERDTALHSVTRGSQVGARVAVLVRKKSTSISAVALQVIRPARPLQLDVADGLVDDCQPAGLPRGVVDGVVGDTARPTSRMPTNRRMNTGRINANSTMDCPPAVSCRLVMASTVIVVVVRRALRCSR